jgi:multimeric flavodoxin WrbA
VRAVILDGHSVKSQLGETLLEELELQSWEVESFFLSDMEILPCRSCGSCGTKTPGTCIINDEMELVYRAVANCDVMIFFTPIQFGGYSAALKKAVDRLMTMGLPLYRVRGDHLLHPIRYGNKRLMGVGTYTHCDGEEAVNFELLVKRNALNMMSPAFSHHVFCPKLELHSVRTLIQGMIKEVTA